MKINVFILLWVAVYIASCNKSTCHNFTHSETYALLDSINQRRNIEYGYFHNLPKNKIDSLIIHHYTINEKYINRINELEKENLKLYGYGFKNNCRNTLPKSLDSLFNTFKTMGFEVYTTQGNTYNITVKKNYYFIRYEKQASYEVLQFINTKHDSLFSPIIVNENLNMHLHELSKRVYIYETYCKNNSQKKYNDYFTLLYYHSLRSFMFGAPKSPSYDIKNNLFFPNFSKVYEQHCIDYPNYTSSHIIQKIVNNSKDIDQKKKLFDQLFFTQYPLEKSR